MPKRPHNYIPPITRHTPSGRARVRLSGHDHYLGPWPSHLDQPPPQVQAAYQSLVAEWLANGRRPLRDDTGPNVGEVFLAYWNHAVAYYRRPDGSPTGQTELIRLAVRPLLQLYSELPAREFGPLKLKAVRDQMVKADLSRRVVNQRIGYVKRMFRWAVENELVPPAVFEGLRAVAGLRAGRSTARESEPVQPVPPEHVEAVLPHLRPPVRAMVELQRLTGMRPGEVMVMRADDLDTTGPLWLYRPKQHKGRHHGRDRVVCLGPRAQDVLRPFLGAGPDAYLFSPVRDREARLAARSAARKTPRWPSHVRHMRRKRRVAPKRLPRARYDKNSYRCAIVRACEAAGVPAWHPHQLRHLHATEVRKRYGLEAAQVALGHAKADVTQIYAERNLALAERIAAEVG